jgi:putative transposase
MSDYRRWRLPGGVFFFTLVTHERRPILTTPLALRHLRFAFRDVRRRMPFDTLAFAVLPDHLHAVWAMPPSDVDFDRRWSRFKSVFTLRYLAAGGTEGFRSASRTDRRERAVWQRRYWEHCCRDEAAVKACVDYVHWNPVKHGHAARPLDWPWSTFRRWVKIGEYPPHWGEGAPPTDLEMRIVGE